MKFTFDISGKFLKLNQALNEEHILKFFKTLFSVPDVLSAQT